MKVQQVQQVQQPVFQFAKLFWINYFVVIILEATTLLHYYTTTLITPFIPFSIQLYGHQKIIHIIGPTFCVCSSPCFTAPSFSVRKCVYFVHTILTIYLTILHSFLSVSSRRCGACAAPSAEHARPQASPSIFEQSGISQNNKKTVVDFLVVSYCLKLEYAKVFWRYQGMMIIWMHSFILHQLNDAHRLHFSTKQILRTISTPNLQIFW